MFELAEYACGFRLAESLAYSSPAPRTSSKLAGSFLRLFPWTLGASSVAPNPLARHRPTWFPLKVLAVDLTRANESKDDRQLCQVSDESLVLWSRSRRSWHQPRDPA